MKRTETGTKKTLTRDKYVNKNRRAYRELAEMRRPFARRRLSTRRELKDNRGGRRLLLPSTHTQAKYHQPHRSETHRHAGPWNPVEGIGWRPPEESAGGSTGWTTGNHDAGGGGD